MLPNYCKCSDDLSYICDAHASLSWYAFRLVDKFPPSGVMLLEEFWRLYNGKLADPHRLDAGYPYGWNT